MGPFGSTRKAKYLEPVKRHAFRSKLALQGEKNLAGQGELIQLAFDGKTPIAQKKRGKALPAQKKIG